jgi:hypothetical protein
MIPDGVMSGFDQAKMSPDERQFIQTYCIAIQRDYDLLQIIRGLLAPDGLGLTCAIHATKLAKTLHGQQLFYCSKFAALGATFAPSAKALLAKKEVTPPELVAGIFTQSFFKLVDSETKQVLITDKNLPSHDGWSSGHPADWQQMIKAMQEIHDQKLQTNQLSNSALVNALLKLFSMLPPILPTKKWTEEDADLLEAEYYEDDEEAYNEEEEEDYDDDTEESDDDDTDLDHYM